MDVANQPTPPPGASLEGVDQGRFMRVLFNSVDRPRKKLITKLNILFYSPPLSNLERPPNDGIALPPHVPLVAYPLNSPLHCGCLFLVGCCVLVRQLAANLCHRVFYIYHFCIAPFNITNDGTVFPHALHPQRVTSPDSLPPPMPTLGWLLCFPFKFWPLKAKAMPITLFFDGVCVGIPNKGTSRGAAKPDHRRLAWDHRRPRRHVLWAPLTYPWRERAKPLGGRAAASHVYCCVFCVVVFPPGPYF